MTIEDLVPLTNGLTVIACGNTVVMAPHYADQKRRDEVPVGRDGLRPAAAGPVRVRVLTATPDEVTQDPAARGEERHPPGVERWTARAETFVIALTTRFVLVPHGHSAPSSSYRSTRVSRPVRQEIQCRELRAFFLQAEPVLLRPCAPRFRILRRMMASKGATSQVFQSLLESTSQGASPCLHEIGTLRA